MLYHPPAVTFSGDLAAAPAFLTLGKPGGEEGPPSEPLTQIQVSQGRAVVPPGRAFLGGGETQRPRWPAGLHTRPRWCWRQMVSSLWAGDPSPSPSFLGALPGLKSRPPRTVGQLGNLIVGGLLRAGGPMQGHQTVFAND